MNVKETLKNIEHYLYIYKGIKANAEFCIKANKYTNNRNLSTWEKDIKNSIIMINSLLCCKAIFLKELNK